MSTLTPRDLELIEVALDSCANSVQSGATLRNKRGLDPLAREYLEALERVQKIKPPPSAEALAPVIQEWLDNGYDDTDDTGYQATVLAQRLVES